MTARASSGRCAAAYASASRQPTPAGPVVVGRVERGFERRIASSTSPSCSSASPSAAARRRRRARRRRPGRAWSRIAGAVAALPCWRSTHASMTSGNVRMPSSGIWWATSQKCARQVAYSASWPSSASARTTEPVAITSPQRSPISWNSAIASLPRSTLSRVRPLHSATFASSTSIMPTAQRLPVSRPSIAMCSAIAAASSSRPWL